MKPITRFKVTYLDEVPDKIRSRSTAYAIQSILDEFMATDKPAMEVDFAGHYKTDAVGATTWRNAIKNSGYALSLIKSEGRYVVIKDVMANE